MMQTIGQRLKEEREEQRLTFEKVFEATRIRVQYLQALEADDLSVIPSPVQARGYLRNYAEYLGLDVDRMLDDMRVINAQQTLGEIIGPADDTDSRPHQDKESLDVRAVTQTSEAYDVPQNTSALIEEPASTTQHDFANQINPSPDVTIPIKPKLSPALPGTVRQDRRAPGASVDKTLDKPGRRKKAVSRPEAAFADSPTKQRGRKKAEPESAPVVEAEPGWQSRSEEASVPSESVSEPEALVEQASPVQQNETPPADVSDTIWQTWLNRLSSILSARAKRRTLIPKESPVLENEPMVLTAEADVTPEGEVQDRLIERSDEISKEIGNELRQRRELLSLHFDEVERNTHVKAHYLDALERGALDELPSTVQTRGMLSNYATFLDMDVDALLLRFADALQARYRERNPQKPQRKPGQPIIANVPPVRSFIAGDMIFGVSMAILLIGFAIWGVSRVMTIQSQREIKPTAPSISDVLLAPPDPSSFTATPTFLPVESFPGEPTVTVEIPTQNVNAEVQLNLVAVERTFMRVVVDGEVAFEGRVVPGNAYPFEAENQIEVLVGSGAAIRTVYNGRDLGLMGTFGQVVNNIYLGTEIITPTALPSATPTITLTPTRTAPPTATSRFTATPLPSATAVP